MTADVHAELVVAACAIASPLGARLAHERLSVDHFTRPYLADLFDVAPRLPTSTNVDAAPLRYVRADAAASATGIHGPHVRRLVDESPITNDKAGGYAARLIVAAHRRSCAVALEEALLRVAAGEDGMEVARFVGLISDALADPACLVDLEAVSHDVSHLRATR